MSTLAGSTAAFRRSLNDRIRATARARGVSAQQLQRQFLLQRFLARVFDVPDGPWVLKGGAGLLVRIPGARHSQDVDLARAGTDVATAVAELRELAGRDVGDPLRFVVGDPTSMTGARPGAQVRVDVYLGVTRFDRFPVDLATGGRLVTRLDHARPAPAVGGRPARPSRAAHLRALPPGRPSRRQGLRNVRGARPPRKAVHALPRPSRPAQRSTHPAPVGPPGTGPSPARAPSTRPFATSTPPWPRPEHA